MSNEERFLFHVEEEEDES